MNEAPPRGQPAWPDRPGLRAEGRILRGGWRQAGSRKQLRVARRVRVCLSARVCRVYSVHGRPTTHRPEEVSCAPFSSVPSFWYLSRVLHMKFSEPTHAWPDCSPTVRPSGGRGSRMISGGSSSCCRATWWRSAMTPPGRIALPCSRRRKRSRRAARNLCASTSRGPSSRSLGMSRSCTLATSSSSKRTAGGRCRRAEPRRCSCGATVCGRTPAGISTRVTERRRCRNPRVFRGRTVGRSACGDKLGELLQVDIAAGDNGDDRPRTGFAGERSRQAERTSSLGDDAGLFRHESHGALYLVQAHHDVAVHDRLHALPHPGKHALAARAVDERGLPIRERLRRAFRKRERRGRGGLRLGAPHFDFRAQRLHGTGDARDQAATADRGNDGSRFRGILENLQAHGRVTGYEVLIVEWMDKRPYDARI